MTTDLVVHDLAPEGAEMLSGTFTPVSNLVEFEVGAAYAFLGNSRAALILYVGQPDEAGSRIYDSGGKPVEGAEWYPVGSVNGESAWATTTHRRIPVEVDPSKPVTWTVSAAIIGGGELIPVAESPRDIVITPDGTKAFVNSTTKPVVTPIRLGRPRYSFTSELSPNDAALEAFSVGGMALCLGADDSHLVVGLAGSISVFSVTKHDHVVSVEIDDATPAAIALLPDGSSALVVTEEGSVIRLSLPGGDVEIAEIGGQLVGVDAHKDGQFAFVADRSGRVQRIDLRGLSVDAEAEVSDTPRRLGVSPDSKVWVLCRTDAGANGRLKALDPKSLSMIADYELFFPDPLDFDIIPVEGQTSDTVRTAWVVFEKGRYCELNIGGAFAGTVHSIHRGAFGEDPNGASGIAVNDFGEIWVVRSEIDSVWKWVGGRFICRTAGGGFPTIFFGEYLDVTVHGAAG